MRAINKRLGRKPTMLLGLIFIFGSTLLFWFIFKVPKIIPLPATLIVACVLLGIGTSTSNICSFSLTSDLIGLNTECCAFVYGIMSFADKLANGIAIAVIQQFNPCTSSSTEKCSLYYREILSFIPAGVAVLTVLMVISIWRTDIGAGRHVQIEARSDDLSISRSYAARDEETDERRPLIA